MTLFLDDGDVTLYHGDALETVRGLPDGSVDCVVTSPPYWGLRDYGTGEWDGGDPDCDHDAALRAKAIAHVGKDGFSASRESQLSSAAAIHGKNGCPSCGARRVDRQMGLEPTPELFVQGMVELFREIRRVLAPHGTCWVNLGDSYATSGGNDRNGSSDGAVGRGDRPDERLRAGLKPKDLVGIPWRVAFALQQDGWWLRSDIIWAKPNPMPESVTDRPTKAHEYVFLLTKQPRYWFDTEAVREPAQYGYSETTNGRDVKWKAALGDATRSPTREPTTVKPGDGTGGRNVRSVWQIATQPYPEAHFATYPEELARRCILAGCPTRVCRVCGKPSERIVEASYSPHWKGGYIAVKDADDPRVAGGNASGYQKDGERAPRMQKDTSTVGWSDCGHNNWRSGVTLDPFIGSGTTAKVARDHQRHAIGIDLNPEYLELAARRLQQLSLLT